MAGPPSPCHQCRVARLICFGRSGSINECLDDAEPAVRGNRIVEVPFSYSDGPFVLTFEDAVATNRRAAPLDLTIAIIAPHSLACDIPVSDILHVVRYDCAWRNFLSLGGRMECDGGKKDCDLSGLMDENAAQRHDGHGDSFWRGSERSSVLIASIGHIIGPSTLSTRSTCSAVGHDPSRAVPWRQELCFGGFSRM